MSDALGFGAMLFGPEHALKVAAEAVETNAKSTDMAVGIILGIRASIEEYQRLFTTAPTNNPEVTAELTRPEQKPEDKPNKAKERVGGLSRA